MYFAILWHNLICSFQPLNWRTKQTMPRSKKTKKWVKPPPRSPTECISSKSSENILITKEHQNDWPGHGNGNVTRAFSAVLANVNEISCFKENFLMTLLGIWIINMKDRTLRDHTDTIRNGKRVRRSCWNLGSMKGGILFSLVQT